MPEVPPYPAGHPGDASEPDSDPQSRPVARCSTYLWWIVGIVVLALFVVLHLTGVLGPGGH